MIEQFDVHSGPFAEDPYAILARLREEVPVFWHEKLNGYWVTRYQEVMRVVSDETFLPFHPDQSNPSPGNLVLMHGEEHDRYRKLVTPAFSVRAIRQGMEPRLSGIANQLIDAFVSDGHVDLVHAFANPLPAIVIREILQLPELDEIKFMRDAEILLEFAADPMNPQLVPEYPGAVQRVQDFIYGVVEREHREPAGGFITQLIESEVDGQSLNDEEVANFCVLLCIAGVETTQRLVANMVYALCRHPDQFAALVADESVMLPAIDETLRWLPPNQFRMRYAGGDLELHGVKIARGTLLYAMTGGANRDPRAFDDPEAFNINRFREARKHMPYLSFGWGPHFCLGAFLAKLETQYAMSALLARLNKMRLDPAHEVRFLGFRNRSPDSLHLLFEA